MYDEENHEIKTWEEDNYYGGGLPDSWYRNESDFEPEPEDLRRTTLQK